MRLSVVLFLIALILLPGQSTLSDRGAYVDNRSVD